MSDLGPFHIRIEATDWQPMTNLADFNTPVITRRVRLRLWLAGKLIPKDWVISGGLTWLKIGYGDTDD